MINTLAALLVALTVGTVLLMVMETAPVRPEVESLIADTTAGQSPIETIRQTDVPLQPLNWRNIVIHATGAEGDRIARKCHFVIEPDARTGAPTVRATELWKRQAHSRHIVGANESFNDSSVAICLVGDFSETAGPRRQFNELISLVGSLQYEFRISRGHVYLHRDLNGRSRSPGKAFAAREFFARLTPTR